MKLKRIEIELQPSYSSNAGKYVATIQYVDRKDNEVKLVLAPEISEALIGFLGPTITEFSARAAKEIEANITIALAEMKRPEIAI